MIHWNYKRLLVGVAIVASMGASGVTNAHAATTLVLSDHVTFKGTATPNGTTGSYTFSSSKCTLTSDGEPPVLPCQLNGTVTFNSATGAITGTGTVQSSDGRTDFAFTLTPSAAGGTKYKLTGSGKESDTPDPGQPPASYPCKVRGSVNAVPQPNGTIALNGAFNVLEKNTAP